MFRLGIICGGPSLERGISLNSARCVYDHLKSETLQIELLYVDRSLDFYLISESQLYSNTPSDFDFKLHQVAHKLVGQDLKLKLLELDMVFPCIHGHFGETGELQGLLESMGVPFVGSPKVACGQLFFKHKASQILMANGFGTLPVAVLKKGQANNSAIVARFFNTHQLTRAIVKPSAGGSSIGVHSVSTVEEALDKANHLFEKGMDDAVLLEPFVQGKEFTVLVFEREGHPVALIPTEIELSYDNHAFLDYRRKYLPTANTLYHTPPRFGLTLIQSIQSEAEAIFKLFGMRDFGRIDGWVLPTGQILFTDINPISGMEQNSFLFRQTSVVGLNHTAALMSILENACQRWGRICPSRPIEVKNQKKPVYILFGGQTAERQVSLMSGTNVWLKLQHSQDYSPTPYFWDTAGKIWSLPYSYALNHTVEEVMVNCQEADLLQPLVDQLARPIKNRWGPTGILFEEWVPPNSYSLDVFLKKVREDNAFLFIGLHGGVGENGELQEKLAHYQIIHNGVKAQSAKLCMDKYETGLCIQKAQYPGLIALPKLRFHLEELLKKQKELWPLLIELLKTKAFILKPQHDGCSAGIVKIESEQDLFHYLDYAVSSSAFIPAGVFKGQSQPIEMPPSTYTDYIFEPYITVDSLSVEQGQLIQFEGDGWVEITVGVLEHGGNYHALSPSITIAEGAVLSLEEKFQGGTGVNLTPPPSDILEEGMIQHIRHLIEQAAAILGIVNYARLDAFYNRKTRTLILIEANTLPGLTPSTVIYHQAFAENPPLNPLQFLEHIIETAAS